MKTLIVGGGLSGLALAEKMQTQGHDYQLVEARARFGGRIMTEHLDDGYFDMGPAWFWPGQPRIAALLDRLNLKMFDQFADGALVYEDENGHVQRGRGFASMQGSWRLRGGLMALTDALADRLPDDRKQLNAEVVDLAPSAGGITAIFADGATMQADRVVIAMPPRVTAQIAPTLPDETLLAMRNVATWMAGQAKAIAVYDTPFWREAGLSGDATSRRGPMVEIHDASPETGGPYALFGFIGVPPQARADEDALRHHIKAQLAWLFGPQAGSPKQLYIKDWAFDRFTATDADQAPLYAHPDYGLPPAMQNLWGGRLVFAGTEVAPTFGGYIEGALEAADAALAVLQST